MKILLLSGGFVDEEFAAGFLKKHCFDKIIAVDGGLETAFRLAASPLTDIVGDFDTVEPEILKLYREMPDGPVIHRFNPEKDYTDTDIALKLAIAKCRECPDTSQIWILGATGTRLDHVLANISMLLQPFKAGIPAYIQDKNNLIFLLSGSMAIDREGQFGHYLSLIPLTQTLEGVTLEGVKYPLKDHRVYRGESLCVSNEITGARAVLTVREGIAIVLETKD